ncbi:MAG: hypothetical protein RLZZ127_206 [Planctomycetota bacterium]
MTAAPDPVPGRWLVAACLALTGIGVAAVASAVWDPARPAGLGREAVAQLGWCAVALAAGWTAARIPFAWWRSAAAPAWIAAVLVVLAMTVLAGTALVPRIKGQANWVVLGPLRIQPVEGLKIALLLAVAGLAAWPGFDARRLAHLLAAGLVAGVPAALIAREDLGSALTLVPMLAAVLVAAGMRIRHLVLGGMLAAAVVAAGVASLPQEGPKAYQWRRIQAWWNPQDYQLTEGFQSERSVRSIGSGGWFGQGFAQGDQNRLGWVPEKHTDLISAVIGEEGGFAACAVLLALYAATALCLLRMARDARDPMARLVLAGAAGLLAGQAFINLAVATRLMPVTGVTLPFVSYGGSSLVASWLLIGICRSAAAARGA